MSIGQIAEILTMSCSASALKRLGWRTTMIIGILGHAARFAVFAFLPEHPALVVRVNMLHGIAYAFFFATVYIFVDEFFPKDVRASAQGLFNLQILGFGPLVANTTRPDSDQRNVQPWRTGRFPWPVPGAAHRGRSARQSRWRCSSIRPGTTQKRGRSAGYLALIR